MAKVSQMQGVPAHLEVLKSNDGRRHPAQCIFSEGKGEARICTCPQSDLYYKRCRSAKRCPYYEKTGELKSMKKRILLSLLIVCISILVLGTITASAAETADGICYEERPNSIEITDVTDTNITELVIPSEINGKPVTYINSSAFYGCRSLTSVTIPESVTDISDGTFFDGSLSSLQSIIVDEGNTAYQSIVFHLGTGVSLMLRQRILPVIITRNISLNTF